MIRFLQSIFVFIWVFTSYTYVKAQPVIAYQTIISGLVNPVDMVHSGDGSGNLYIAQQNGIIHRWNGSSLSTFLNISTLLTSPLGGEQGLLSLAFHPQYAANGYLFVYYTNSSGAITLARYRRDLVNPNIADPGTGTVLLTIAKPGTPYFTNHNGGKIIFGADGMLYFGTGDGGSGGDPFNHAQNLTSLLGKMLRIDVNGFATSPPYYTIPAGNPFIGAGGGIREEIWAYGLRNPWRWSFDRLNQDMWIGDVGQNAWEEVNHVAAGSTAGINYGWRCYEGNQAYNTTSCSGTYTYPVFVYGHNNSTGGYSITGGYVYRGTEFSSLYGMYVTADYVTGNLWLVKKDGAVYNTAIQTGLPASISSFAEGEDGTLYAVRRLSSNATVSKLVVTSVIPLSLTNLQAFYRDGYTDISWNTSFEQNVSQYIIQYSDDNRIFADATSLPSSGNSTGSRYTFRHHLPLNNIRYYRVATVQANGLITYSEVKTVRANGGDVKLQSTIINGNSLHVSINKALQQITIQSINGATVYKQSLVNASGITRINIPHLPAGIYVAVFYSNERLYHEKFIITR